jgi:hypothetical protein
MLRPRPTSEKDGSHASCDRASGRMSTAAGSGPSFAGVFPLAAAADAHRAFESGQHIGKLVLEVIPEVSIPESNIS